MKKITTSIFVCIALLLVGACTVTILLNLGFGKNEVVIPSANDVTAMRFLGVSPGTVDGDTSLPGTISFEIPREQWTSVISELSPTKPGPNPYPKWPVLGQLEITVKSGPPFHVWIYFVGYHTVAWTSVGTDNTVFLAETIREFEDIMKAAYNSSKQKQK